MIGKILCGLVLFAVAGAAIDFRLKHRRLKPINCRFGCGAGQFSTPVGRAWMLAHERECNERPDAPERAPACNVNSECTLCPQSAPGTPICPYAGATAPASAPPVPARRKHKGRKPCSYSRALCGPRTPRAGRKAPKGT